MANVEKVAFRHVEKFEVGQSTFRASKFECYSKMSKILILRKLRVSVNQFFHTDLSRYYFNQMDGIENFTYNRNQDTLRPYDVSTAAVFSFIGISPWACILRNLPLSSVLLLSRKVVFSYHSADREASN